MPNYKCFIMCFSIVAIQLSLQPKVNQINQIISYVCWNYVILGCYIGKSRDLLGFLKKVGEPHNDTVLVTFVFKSVVI